MWNTKQKINYVLYKIFAAWLPVSQRSALAKKIRYFFSKHICKSGKNVNIERNANFSRTDIPIMEQGNSPVEPVEIGDDCRLGRRVIIMPGVKIGRGCVIAAGAVVTKDIPDYSVAGGVPARVIKSRL